MKDIRNIIRKNLLLRPDYSVLIKAVDSLYMPNVEDVKLYLRKNAIDV